MAGKEAVAGSTSLAAIADDWAGRDGLSLAKMCRRVDPEQAGEILARSLRTAYWRGAADRQEADVVLAEQFKRAAANASLDTGTNEHDCWTRAEMADEIAAAISDVRLPGWDGKS